MGNLFGSPVFNPIATAETIDILLAEALEKLPKAVFVLCCDEFFNDREDVSIVLKKYSIPIFGAVFPKVIWQGEVKQHGCLIVPVLVETVVNVFTGLSAITASQFQFSSQMKNVQSAIVLVDGFSRNIDFALNQLLHQFGSEVDTFGGGAGSLSFDQKPCLFSNDGLLEDAMLVATLPERWNLSIGHGWETIDGPFLANKVDNNKIQQLNFQPAADIYQKVIKSQKGIIFSNENFFDVAKTFPFGLKRLDDDILVRDPVTIEGNELLCVGQIPENALLYVLKGIPENIIKAAVSSVKEKEIRAQSQAILFDCISRQLFLAESFMDELSGIQSALGDDNLMFGALVFGEIASGASGGIHFHNKTSVTAITKSKY